MVEVVVKCVDIQSFQIIFLQRCLRCYRKLAKTSRSSRRSTKEPSERSTKQSTLRLTLKLQSKSNLLTPNIPNLSTSVSSITTSIMILPSLIKEFPMSTTAPLKVSHNLCRWLQRFDHGFDGPISWISLQSDPQKILT